MMEAWHGGRELMQVDPFQGTAFSFQGTWVFDAERSKLTTPAPSRWIQWIRFEGSWVRIREEITHAGGTALVAVEAFPGAGFFPVKGSPVADEISYRVLGATIAGVARKSGQVTFRERMDFSEPGAMVADLSLIVEGREVSFGRAVFRRVPGSEVPPNLPAWLPATW